MLKYVLYKVNSYFDKVFVAIQCFMLQRHLARTSARWKDPPKKNALNELQDELMSIRLREAETQAEIREMKQRMMEMETQV